MIGQIVDVDSFGSFVPKFDARVLARIAGRDEMFVASIVGWLNKTAHVYHIDEPLEVAAWLAQIAHESGGFVFRRELWSAQRGAAWRWQRWYERTPGAAWPDTKADDTNRTAWRLGNSELGDGFMFRGGGWMQLTGRGNYTRCAASYGLTAEALNEKIEGDKFASLTAGWYWRDRGIGAVACRGDFTEVTRIINGGYNGLEDRERRYAIARSELSIA